MLKTIFDLHFQKIMQQTKSIFHIVQFDIYVNLKLKIIFNFR